MNIDFILSKVKNGSRLAWIPLSVSGRKGNPECRQLLLDGIHIFDTATQIEVIECDQLEQEEENEIGVIGYRYKEALQRMRND